MFLKSKNMYNNSVGPKSFNSYINTSSYESQLSLSQSGHSYPSELQHMIPDHWRNFTAIENTDLLIIFVIYLLLMVISLFGNGLVLLIFGTSKVLRTPSNLLIMNLAVFDLIMWWNLPHKLVNQYFGYMVGGDFGCDIFATFGSVSGIGAAMSNAFIAYDRYRTISNPIDGRLTYKQIYFSIFMCWVWTMPFTVLPLFHIWGRFVPEGCLTTSSFDYITDSYEIRSFVYSIFVWAFCTPLTIIVTCYTKLFFHVRDHERMLEEQAKKMNVKSLSANVQSDGFSVELRIAKASMIIYLLYLTAWTPYATVSILAVSNNRHLINPYVSALPALFAKSVSCIDPWVYAASHPKYRAELEKRVPWLGIRERNNSSTSGSTTGAADTEAGTLVMD